MPFAQVGCCEIKLYLISMLIQFPKRCLARELGGWIIITRCQLMCVFVTHSRLIQHASSNKRIFEYRYLWKTKGLLFNPIERRKV